MKIKWGFTFVALMLLCWGRDSYSAVPECLPYAKRNINRLKTKVLQDPEAPFTHPELLQHNRFAHFRWIVFDQVLWCPYFEVYSEALRVTAEMGFNIYDNDHRYRRRLYNMEHSQLPLRKHTVGQARTRVRVTRELLQSNSELEKIYFQSCHCPGKR